MNDIESKKNINGLRRQIFANEKFEANLSKKKVIATAKIKVKPRQVGVYLTLDDDEPAREEGSNVCDLMELFIEECLHDEIVKNGSQQAIEDSIKQSFIKLLPPTNDDYRIQKLNIRLIDDEVGDLIEPDPVWLEKQDLTTETE